MVLSVQITPSRSLCVPRESRENSGRDLHDFCQKTIYGHLKQSLQSEIILDGLVILLGSNQFLFKDYFTKTDITRKNKN